jgi:hypothetical protein
MKETACRFGTQESLVGILTDPPEDSRTEKLPAVLILNAGRLHRVGPNRLAVNMARAVAALGCVVFRFDFSGIGDSEVRGDSLPFARSAVLETQDAMHYVQEVRGSTQFVLMGICSGAKISFATAGCDQRVIGAILLNPWWHFHAPDEAHALALRNRVMARHYRRMAMHSSFRRKNWRKAFRGKVDYRGLWQAIWGLLRRPGMPLPQDIAAPPAALAALDAVTERGVRLLHVHSEGDAGLDYLHVALGSAGVQRLRTDDRLGLEIIPGANHTFTPLWSQDALLKIIRRFLLSLTTPRQSVTHY